MQGWRSFALAALFGLAPSLALADNSVDLPACQRPSICPPISIGSLDPLVTHQGNTFNGASQLVQLLGNGKLPALDGSNLTGITATAAPGGSPGQVQVNVAGALGAYPSFTFDGSTLSIATTLISSNSALIVRSPYAGGLSSGYDMLFYTGDVSGNSLNVTAGGFKVLTGKPLTAVLNAGNYSGDILLQTGNSAGTYPIGSGVGQILLQTGFSNTRVGGKTLYNIPIDVGIMIRAGFCLNCLHGASVEIVGSSGTTLAGDVILKGGDTSGNFSSGNVQLVAGNHGQIIVTGNMNVSGTISGNGSGLTNLPAPNASGNNMDVQFNNGGPIGGDDNFQWDSTNRVLIIDTVEFGWKKYSFDNTSFAVASTSTEVTLFTLAPGAIIEGIKIKHSTNFSGGSISTYTVSVGLSGNDSKYASAFNVFSAPGSTNFQLTRDFVSEDNDNPTTVVIQAVSGGGTLDQASQGNVDIWVKTSVAN